MELFLIVCVEREKMENVPLSSYLGRLYSKLRNRKRE